ncbi:MAG: glycosyltransferase family 4 protein [Alphaproteobacteria bacterium]|nr:glycosyltransferase family 4 protein [Alphaproteobacteria bacterium]
MKIVFLSPPVSVINGGIKHIFRMAETLIALGREAVVFEQSGRRPSWFLSTAPVVGQEIFEPGADHLYVLPEDQPHILREFSRVPQRKVVYSQNQFYGAQGLGGREDYTAYGVSAVLCSSRSIYEHVRVRHPSLPAFVVPCAVDPTVFRPAPVKRDEIVFLPRKRAIEAAYLRDMFSFLHPEYDSWSWVSVDGCSEADVARSMGEAKVFLSLSRLEGFGLTPLEAMAAGCVVAGFTGIGGREYASETNGFWADEDDFPACLEGLERAVSLDEAARQAYTAACAPTLDAYTPRAFEKGVADAWRTILDF